MSGPASVHRIRPARLWEKFAIHRLIETVYRPQLEKHGLWESRPRINLWWQMLNRRMFVIAQGRSLLGTVGLQETSLELFVFLLAVSPGAQGRGLGRALIEFAEQHAWRRGFRRLLLATPEVFVGAIDFYQRLGFFEIGRQTQHGIAMVVFLKRWNVTAPHPAAASAHRR